MSAALETGEAFISGAAIVAIMNRDAHAALRELRGEHPADAARGARYERDARELKARRLAPSLT